MSIGEFLVASACILLVVAFLGVIWGELKRMFW